MMLMCPHADSKTEYIDSIRPRGWDFELWQDAYQIADSFTREELLGFMSVYIKGLETFSKTEMIDILPEIGLPAGRLLVNRYEDRLSTKRVLKSQPRGVDALQNRKATRQ